MIGGTVMLVAVASEGLTLLGGVSIIGHSVRSRAEMLLVREQQLVVAALEEPVPGKDLATRVRDLARGFPGGRLEFVPFGADGRLPPDVRIDGAWQRTLLAGHAAVFCQPTQSNGAAFTLLTPLTAAGAPNPGMFRSAGVLVVSHPEAPLFAEAQSERDGLVGTAVLTLILLGYALVGVSQWLGTQLESREVGLSRAKRELELALSHMSDGLCVCDADGFITVFNQRFCEILELPDETATRGAALPALLATSFAAYRARRQGDADPTQMPSQAAGDGPVRVVGETSAGRLIELTYSLVTEGGWLVTFSDITERMRAQKQIAFMAEHDALTGLLNRASFADWLARMIASAREETPLAVLCLDLDHFKQINDEWGHPVGDLVLRTVAERLRMGLREREATAFRLGGDEFAVLLARTGAMEAEQVAYRLLRLLNEECQIGGRRYQPEISIGIALAPADAITADRLMSRADLALYSAKRSGRNTVQSFRSELEQRSVRRLEMERQLSRALHENQLELWYQPVRSAELGQLVCFEALLRWRHPQRGLVLPSEFISLAEEMRLIEEIGVWALEQACSEAATWPGSIAVAVNLSAVQLRSPHLPAQVKRALLRSQLAAPRLELEVTETAIIQDAQTAFGVLRSLQKEGVNIALDDFGTGYSSLSFLTRFSFDSIKIDRSFVRDMDVRSECAAIVEALSWLGAHLELATTAEGIETPQQLDRVRKLGCHRVQGYLLGRPIPASAARESAWAEASTPYRLVGRPSLTAAG